MKLKKLITIRTNDKDKQLVKDVAQRNGFRTISAFFWYCVNYFKHKQGGEND